jgi:hypothetical protein
MNDGGTMYWCEIVKDDGLYAVIKDGARPFVAGFIVADHQVERDKCAPILRKNLSYWAKYARKVVLGSDEERPASPDDAGRSAD